MKRLLITLILPVLLAGCVTVVMPGENRPATPQTAAGGSPVIKSFTAKPDIIRAGDASVISWSVSGATRISIVPDIGPADSEISITVYPTVTTDYTLTAQNQAGTVGQTISVVVKPAAGEPAAGQSERTAVLSLVNLESGSLIKGTSDYAWANTVCAGDNAGNMASRAFLSFDISSIPPSATVTEAVLDFSGYSAAGNPTYASANWGNMGALDIYQYQYGPSINNSRLIYDASAAKAGSLKLTDMKDTGLKLNVTNNATGGNTIGQLMAVGQSRCQFRVQFFTSTNWDSKADMVCLEGAVLRIKYYLP